MYMNIYQVFKTQKNKKRNIYIYIYIFFLVIEDIYLSLKNGDKKSDQD